MLNRPTLPAEARQSLFPLSPDALRTLLERYGS